MIIELEKKATAFGEEIEYPQEVEEDEVIEKLIIDIEERRSFLKIFMIIGVFLSISAIIIYGGYKDYKVDAKAHDLEEQVQTLQDEIEMLKIQANQPENTTSLPLETGVE